MTENDPFNTMSNTPHNNAKRRKEWQDRANVVGRENAKKLLKRTVAVHARAFGMATLAEVENVVAKDSNGLFTNEDVSSAEKPEKYTILRVEDNVYSPCKPRLRANDVKALSKNVDVALLSSRDGPGHLKDEVLVNKSNSVLKCSLKQFPGFFNFLRAILEREVKDFWKALWNFDSTEVSDIERQLIQAASISLGDFYLMTLKINRNFSEAERTPFL